MVRERILQYLELKGITRYAFYKKTGLSNGFLDKKSSVSTSSCEKIFNCYPDISPEWLITGKGEMLNTKGQINQSHSILNEPEVEYRASNKVGIPLIPMDAMAGMSNGDNTILKLDCEYYTIPDFKNKADYLIRISGTSMSPKYYNGDVVACKIIPKETFIQWGKVYVMDTIQGALCKRLFPSEKGDDYIKVVSDNEKYPAFDMPKKEIRALAIVIGVIRLE